MAKLMYNSECGQVARRRRRNKVAGHPTPEQREHIVQMTKQGELSPKAYERFMGRSWIDKN